MKYKTPEDIRLKAKAKRDAIKAAGGAPYDELLARERVSRSAFRTRHPEKTRADRKRHEKTRPGYRRKRTLTLARQRARARGLSATIKSSDLVWPTHCPVLGIEFDYISREPRNPALPTLDRWDNAKGYVPGNVFVISMRANSLKNNANADELEAVARYARHGFPSGVRCGG